MFKMRINLQLPLFGLLALVGLVLAGPASAAGVESSASHQVGKGAANIDSFWTPQKMRLAERFDPMRGWLEPDDADAAEAAAQRSVPRHMAPLIRPRAVGRLFFTWLGRPASCSGSVIDTRSQRLVLTAGHCVNYLGVWSERMIFVPGYRNGRRPFGSYKARTLWTTGPWVRISWEYGMNYDMGMIVTKRTWNGKRVGDLVGSLPYEAFPRRSGRSRILGYPMGRMNGRSLRACYSSTWAGPRVSATVPGPTGMAARCNMAAGSSGGPWMSAYNSGNGGTEWIVDGLTSTGRRGSNVISSPYFGSHFRRLIYDADY
jgi:V8-like Glu-specific endopeptidase